jgi:outer membrane protein assembly factor BamB
VPSAAAIELDVSDPWEPPERPPARPFIRRTLAVVLLLLALLGGFTAAQPRTSLETSFELSREGVQDVRVDERAIYLLRTTNVDTVVEAYRLRDGHELWRFRQAGILSLADLAGGRVVLSKPNAGADGSDLFALDAADGRLVWRRTSVWMAYHNTSGVADVVMVEPATPGDSDLKPLVTRVRPLSALDPRTGAVRWTMVTPPGAVRTYDYLGTDRTRQLRLGVAQLDPDGTFTLRRGTDGTVLRRARLAVSGAVAVFSLNTDWLLAYATGDAGLARSTAYDLRTGRAVWRQPDRSPDRATPGTSVTWCGTGLLCSSDGAVTTAIDVATGRELWQRPDGDGITDGGGHGLIASSSHITDAGQTVRDTAILDAATGAVRLALPDWQVVDGARWPWLIAVRPTGPGMGVVSRLDARTGSAAVFGRIRALFGPANCMATAEFLICDAEALMVWRIR